MTTVRISNILCKMIHYANTYIPYHIQPEPSVSSVSSVSSISSIHPSILISKMIAVQGTPTYVSRTTQPQHQHHLLPYVSTKPAKHNLSTPTLFPPLSFKRKKKTLYKRPSRFQITHPHPTPPLPFPLALFSRSFLSSFCSVLDQVWVSARFCTYVEG